MIASSVEPVAIVAGAHAVALVVVHDVEVVGVDLKNGHSVDDADVPGGVDRQIPIDRHVADAALLLGAESSLPQ